MTSFGALLAEYRACHGISQVRLAKWMNCHPTYISRLETGKERERRRPSRAMTERLVEALHLNVREANVFRVSAGFAPFHTKGMIERKGDV